MLDKVLVLVALVANRANAAGALANVKDPRTMWFRWAVPLGGGYTGEKPYQTVEEKDADSGKTRTSQNKRKCGVNVAPNSIQKCFYTDCFERLHYGASANSQWGSRRRAAGAQIHASVAEHSYGNYAGCGNQNTKTPNSRRRAGGAYGELAIQCRYKECPAEPQIRQFRYWMHGKDAYKGLEGNNGKTCPGGTQNWGPLGKPTNKETITDFSVKPEESWQWYGTQGTRKCIYARPDPPIVVNGTDTGRHCQCKTVVCRVSVDKEPEKNTGNWGPDGTADTYQKYDECNFMVRIEDVWASPTVPKTWMWNIFSISAFISLSLTGYYYGKYGDKLVTGGSEEGGSDGN